MDANAMKNRTQNLGVQVIRLVESLSKGRVTDVIGKQVIRCATSVGANYRSACRARSRPDFIAKLGIVEEEVDEVIYWLEVLVEVGLVTEGRVEDLRKEANEIVVIVVASINTARRRGDRSSKPTGRLV